MKILLPLIILLSSFTYAFAQECTYTVSPTGTINVGPAATVVEFTVIPSAPNCAWTQSVNTFWVNFIGNMNTNPVRAQFAVQENLGFFARTAAITIAGQERFITQAGVPVPTPTPTPNRTKFDFDSDGKTDFSVFRPSLGEWWHYRSSDGNSRAHQFGLANDQLVPGDYTGDGKTDSAIFRDGWWYILRSEDFSYYGFPFGQTGDIGVPLDIDGDGRMNAAIYRPAENAWYIQVNSGLNYFVSFGQPGCIPSAADFNGDKKEDPSCFYPLTGEWRYWRDFNLPFISAFFPNAAGSKVVAADYTGDGIADMSLYKDGNWTILRSENGTAFIINFGVATDIPTPGDYDGDKIVDYAVYRPSTATWWYAASASGRQHRAVQFGVSTDKPIPGAYVR
ncbi:MAG TPA: hypothetical protein VF556_18930 [Pyrinomonadaceae bacterium]